MQHADAVAIARDLALRAASGELPGLPAPQSIRLNSDGTIAVEGPIAVGRAVQDAARLLEELLSRASEDVAAHAMLRIIVGRAYARDEAAFTSLEQFAHALTPFAAPDVSAVVRALVAVANSLADLDDPEKPDALPEVPHRQASTAPRAIPEPQSMSSDLQTDSVVHAADEDSGLSEFDSEDSPATVVTLRPARDRRRPAARQLGLARSRRLALAGAIALIVVAAVCFGARRLLVDQSHEVSVTRGASGDSLSNPAVSGEPTAQSGATSSAPALGSSAAEPIPGDSVTHSSAGATRAPSAAAEPRSTTPVVAPRADRQRSPISAMPLLQDAAFSPTFATTTSAMFYHSGTGPRSAIMRADTGSDGGVLRVTEVVDDLASNFHPRPSPDGQWIAFDSDRDGERGVYVADANGRGVRRVSGEGFAAVPSWSPHGKRLAFVRAESGRPRVWNIWTVDVATGVTARITAHPFGQPWGAAWFPDGDRIAYQP